MTRLDRTDAVALTDPKTPVTKKDVVAIADFDYYEAIYRDALKTLEFGHTC